MKIEGDRKETVNNSGADPKMKGRRRSNQLKADHRKIVAIILVFALAGAGIYYFLQREGFEEKPKLAIIEVQGTIENFQTAHTVSKIAKDKTIKAAVIEVNSPGGYVSPSFQLESAISSLAERKPTIGAVGQLGASGAYLAVSAVDNLYVHHSSIVGSIGVIAVWTSYKHYLENKGIEHYVFKTAPHKDMFAPWRGPTENEENIIRKEIYRIKDRMLRVIGRNRPVLENNMPKQVISGETIRGFQAVGMNLADGIISTYDEAIKKAAKAAGLKEGEYKIVRAENLYS